jgi:prolipoprotein diacylglyceryltransferase
MLSLNALLDSLPRTRLGRWGRETPAYQGLGIAGFYGALIVVFAGGLLAGRSLLVLAGLALVCALSFFAYTYLRRWITGQERLVLLEHVWFALAASAATLWALREPSAPYLDIVAAGMCFFLAAGRAACTLVGCCHGRPASLGIVYGDECAADGFPRHLVGVRLLPVPAIEMFGLVGIGASGLAALPFARPGLVFAWFLLSYAVLRFGLEGLRGDARPEFLGLSRARWMALAQAGGVLWWLEGAALDRTRIVVACVLLATLVAGLIVMKASDRSRGILRPSHVLEVRAAIPAELPERPLVRATSQGVKIAVSDSGAAFGAEAHVSLSLASGRADLELLCQLAARAFPEVPPEAASPGGRAILHLLVAVPPAAGEYASGSLAARGSALYGAVVRRAQQRPRPEPEPRPWYFTTAGRG